MKVTNKIHKLYHLFRSETANLPKKITLSAEEYSIFLSENNIRNAKNFTYLGMEVDQDIYFPNGLSFISDDNYMIYGSGNLYSMALLYNEDGLFPIQHIKALRLDLSDSNDER